MKVKQEATKVAQSGKRVISNGEQFIQAVSLLTVAVFSYTQLHEHSFHTAIQWVVTGALAVIGIRGAFELIKFLDKE